jgi:hypothetical protein
VGGWRKLHSEELHNFYCSLNIARELKSKRTRWPGHAASMEEVRNLYKILVGKPDGMRALGRSKNILKDNIKMDLAEIRLEDVT